jgi:hypothetical protein
MEVPKTAPLSHLGAWLKSEWYVEVVAEGGTLDRPFLLFPLLVRGPAALTSGDLIAPPKPELSWRADFR